MSLFSSCFLLLLSLFFLPVPFLTAYSIRASVKAIKLDSTPLPVFAEASNTESPVLLVNSRMSSSVTCLSGISDVKPAPSPKSFYLSADFVGLAPDSPTTEVLYSLLVPV